MEIILGFIHEIACLLSLSIIYNLDSKRGFNYIKEQIKRNNFRISPFSGFTC